MCSAVCVALLWANFKLLLGGSVFFLVACLLHYSEGGQCLDDLMIIVSRWLDNTLSF